MKSIFCILSFILFCISIFGEDNFKFEKLKKPLNASICKTNHFADCLAFKYIQHYHPNAKDADWFRNISITHYFEYKLSYQNTREKGDIIFSFESYSDGLEWHYWEDSIIIRIKDPTKIVDTNSAARKIKDKLEAELDENFKLEKITKTISRTLEQNQPNPKEFYSIKEEIIYKVRANGRNFLFNGLGDRID
ncbi:MAG: hypothetical protein IPL26_08975 [Leptospiraceae bacterium]|nr:hypothetical protein [Leptospiraceae bacterium]